ncbi:hypothetical protein PM076_13700 [Halorubrum ezzemoulense]|uniref:Sulfatase N-terminal domain-containing protein n=1 Tax=Halorubrum ezzemoulense TaxID=337243 RepID=A0ABT4Z628_HALEZ|nr:hypothetical protein [Halorubrum ezzemoulense]MDB2245707.1 hypothetical protein [Halorubrum ezzemoulense]MDB2279354.1 hypothetical protein [Halorubrum ezzemoulense]MDB2289876.1 hypothetical protein [Halorubrum ezzemoulense]MDB2292960.1 hypothetical protein [Halorubrum ezzemoulense]MDB2297346.1 hypothetical protein [Halorubrum ezzemoulense]
MYTLSDLKTAIDNPVWFARELNRLYAHRLNLHDHNPDGIDIFEEDWDNLILLDACRYDEFSRHHNLTGRLEKRISRGATSSEFVRGNFTDRELHDTVYVSANAYYAYLEDEINTSVHAYIGLHDEKYRVVKNQTTPPETVTDHAIRTHKEYPNKRLLVHYLQPHQPYLGTYGMERFNHGRGLIDTVKKSNPTRDELFKAYRENLELVLEEVESLLEQLTGKTVISADHGEMLGERMTPIPVREYGHNAGIYNKELLEVPWFIVDNGDRREIVAESPDGSKDFSKEKIRDQLQALGYRE